MTSTNRNDWNTCVICGEQVTTKTRMSGFTGWQREGSDEIAGKQEELVAHPECYLRVGPEEAQRLLAERTAAADEDTNR